MSNRSFEIRRLPVPLQVVLACCTWPHDEGTQAKLAPLLKVPLDEEKLVLLLRHHGVEPMAWHALRPHRNHLLPETVKSLEEDTTRARQRNLAQFTESIRLHSELVQAKVPHLFLKGQALALRAYGDIALRNSRDIDLAVPARHMPQAESILLQQGYQPAFPLLETLSPQERELRFRHYKDAHYYHPVRRLAVELHTRLLESPFLLQGIDWQELTPPKFAISDALPSLPPAEELLYLCVHGSLHGWGRLKWLADIAALLGNLDHDEIEDLRQLAVAHSVSRAVDQAMELSHTLLEAAIDRRPMGKICTCMTSAVLRSITSEGGAKHPESTVRGKFQMLANALLIKPDWQYRGFEMTRRSFPGGDKSGRLLPMWNRLLYPLQRPFNKRRKATL